MKGTNAYNNACDPHLPQIKLPRTGIDQVFSGERPKLIETTREFERIANVNVSALRHHLEPGSGLAASTDA